MVPNPWDMPPLPDDDPPQISRDVMDAAGNLLPTHTPDHGWMPIQTAPLDGKAILLCGGEAWVEDDEDCFNRYPDAVVAAWVRPDAPAWVPPPEGSWRICGSDGVTYSAPKWWQPLPGPPPRPLGRFQDTPKTA